MDKGRSKGKSKGKAGCQPQDQSKRKAAMALKSTAKFRLSSGEYVTLQRGGHSVTSQKYYDVCNAVTKELEGFLMCKKCRTLYSFRPGSGTNHLVRHTQNCDSQGSSTETASKGRAKNAKEIKPVPSSMKSTFKEKIVEMCARDLRPFNIVKGEGMKELLQECINIGAECGKIDIIGILPHPTTISRRVADVADRLRNEILPHVRAAVKKGVCSMDTDLWTDKYTKSHYLTVTSQYVTDEWKLKSNVLLTAEFPSSEQKTGANILQQIEENLSLLDIDLEELKNNVTFVTDEGSNIKLALSNHKRIPCLAHLLATVLRHLLDEGKFLKECPAVLASIQSCRNVVTYLKRSGNCKLLEKTVKTMIDTRMQDWDAELMTDLLDFLMPFKIILEEIQAKKVPTAHLVLLRYYELLDNCDVLETDKEEIIAIKNKGKSLLQEKIKLNDIHYVATFLCPNTRLLLALPETQKQRAHGLVKEMCERLQPHAEQPNCSKDGGPAEKRSRFGKWCQSTADSQTSLLQDELASYVAVGRNDNEDPSALLSWWKSNATMFPRLARLAQRVFAIPATSASSERNFSRAGLLLNSLRTSMSPERVNDLLLMYSFFLNESSDETKKLFQTENHVSDDEGDESGGDEPRGHEDSEEDE